MTRQWATGGLSLKMAVYNIDSGPPLPLENVQSIATTEQHWLCPAPAWPPPPLLSIYVNYKESVPAVLLEVLSTCKQ